MTLKSRKDLKKYSSLAIPLIDKYQDIFKKIVFDYKERGFDNDSGLLYELKEISELIDFQIKKTVKQLDAEIEENMVKTVVIYFIIATVIVCIIILVSVLIIKSVIKEINSAQEQLLQSEKMVSLGGLVAGVAHEINTPIGIALTGISHLYDISNDIIVLYKNDNLSQD